MISRLSNKKAYIIIFFFMMYIGSFSQVTEDVKIIINQDFDIRKISNDYFGNPNLWLYILKYNNVKNLSEIKFGDQIIIPFKKVRNLFSKLNEANKMVQDAVLIGAKILADELLEKANKEYQKAIQFKDALEYDLSEKAANEVITLAKKAYQQTKEIREKTIDAIISFKKGTVQKMFPSIFKWQDAEIYDNLKENDWARTLTLSLADITFYDLSQIKLNENSQAVIQSSRYDRIENKTTTKVKLEKGDAYAMLINSPKKKFDLDIKGIKTKINSRYFWVERNNASTKLSNYNGEISLEVKDSAVIVQKNQGSVVPNDGFPSQPKNLLPPPELIAPLNLSINRDPQQNFKWSKVRSAVSYRLEIATDAEFKKIYDAYRNIKNESMQFSVAQEGIYYWHVCSVDSMGLPGSYSSYKTFIVARDNNKPYLSIESPVNNFVSRDKILIVNGKTDPSSNILINDQNVFPDSQGYFQEKILLENGKNRLVIRAVSNNGTESKLIKEVFFESDADIKINERTFGLLVDNKKITVNKSLVVLDLSTRPLSRVEIKSKQREWLKTGYADTLGNCSITFPMSELYEEFLLSVKTQADFQKSITIILVRNINPPKIVIDPSFLSATNSDTIVIQGTLEFANNLFINDQKIEVDSYNRFFTKQSLKKLNNIFKIKAVDDNGNSSSIEKKVVYDNQPPKLISYSLKQPDNKQSFYILTVKAEDETSLKRAAEVELIVGNKNKIELLEYDSSKNIYEGLLNTGSSEKPEIKTITLEDYLSNKKKYILSK